VRSASDGKINGAVLLDLSAAFDLVDTDVLIRKLVLYKVGSKCKNWISSYLTERHQAVRVDHCYSDFISCNVGVPQGSTLGPLLFLIFVNDLPLYLSCDLEMYADDCTLSSSGKSTAEISQTLSNNCQKVSE